MRAAEARAWQFSSCGPVLFPRISRKNKKFSTDGNFPLDNVILTRYSRVRYDQLYFPPSLALLFPFAPPSRAAQGRLAGSRRSALGGSRFARLGPPMSGDTQPCFRAHRTAHHSPRSSAALLCHEASEGLELPRSGAGTPQQPGVAALHPLRCRSHTRLLYLQSNLRVAESADHRTNSSARGESGA